MSKVIFRFSTDIATSIREAVENISFAGIGDNNSDYEVTDVDIEDEGGQTYTCTVNLDRISGKFVSNDELEAHLTGELSQVDVTIDYI